MAARSACAPHVIVYWLKSSLSAAQAAAFSSGGQGKSGKPCARLIALWASASRVISRITDSEKESAREGWTVMYKSVDGWGF